MGNIKGRYSEEELEEIKTNREKGLKDWHTFVINLQEDQKEIEARVEKLNEVFPNTPETFEEICVNYVYNNIDDIEGNKGGIKDFEAEKQNEYIKVKLEGMNPKKGVKLSSDKPPMAQLFKQFPLAFEQLALRSNMGHEKYIETDKDWMNWKRVPNAIFEYEQAKARHMLKIGKEETDFEHLIAEAWNIMAIIQLKLENK